MKFRRTAGTFLALAIAGCSPADTSRPVDPAVRQYVTRAMGSCDAEASRLAAGQWAGASTALKRCEWADYDLAGVDLPAPIEAACKDAAGAAQNLAKLAPKPGETSETSGVREAAEAWRLARAKCTAILT